MAVSNPYEVSASIKKNVSVSSSPVRNDWIQPEHFVNIRAGLVQIEKRSLLLSTNLEVEDSIPV